MTIPDPQVVIERGNHAQKLLENEHFVAIVDELTSYHLAAMVASPPGDRGRDAREHAHLMQHALTEIVSQLAGYAQAGKAMQDALDRHDDEEDDLTYEH